MDNKERGIRDARIIDCIKQCRERSVPKFLGFLDACGATSTAELCKRENAKYMLFGGYDDAERVYFGVFPEWCQPNKEQFPIVRLKIKNKSQRALLHRDVLGALMSAGIERDTVGDILATGGDPVVFVAESVAPHIIAHIDRIASAGVEIVRDSGEDLPQSGGFLQLDGTVASMRLDCVVAEVANCSRNKATEFITSGMVAVNGFEAVKVTAEVKNGDKVTVRKVGKFIIDNADRITKKGRIAIEYRKYI